MTAESKHHTSGSLGAAITLACTAGFVDAFVFQHVTPVFVANMSGNLIRLGMSAGASNSAGVEASGIALIAFLFGVAAGTIRVDHRLQHGRSHSSSSLLVLEAALLASLTMLLAATHHTYAVSLDRVSFAVITIGATAMGIQAIALRRVGSIAVSTTYGTGALVRLGEKLALGARGTSRPDEIKRRVTVVILTAVLAAYVGGAGLASALNGDRLLLIAPTMATIVAAAALRGQAHTEAAPPSSRDEP